MADEINPYEQWHRQEKVSAIVAVLCAVWQGLSREERAGRSLARAAHGLGREGRELAARVADVNSPSEQTWDLVVITLGQFDHVVATYGLTGALRD